MTMASPNRVGVLLVLGAVLRLAVYGIVDYRIDAGDAAGYMQAGHNLVEHHTFSEETGPNPSSSVYRPPLYGAFVGAALMIHDSANTVRFFQIIVSLASALLAAALARRYSE